MRSFLCLLIIYSYNAVSTRSCKISPIWGIIQGKDLVVGLNSMPELFACLSYKLEDVSISISSQDDSSHRFQLLRCRPPTKSIDGCLQITFLVFDIGIELYYFARFDEIVDPHETITMSTGNQRIFMTKFRQHYFTLLLDSGLQTQFLLQLYFFDYSD